MDNNVHRRKEAKEETHHVQMEICSQSLKDALGNLEFMEVLSKLFGYLLGSLR